MGCLSISNKKCTYKCNCKKKIQKEIQGHQKLRNPKQIFEKWEY
jgi:hypothetical protein